MGGNALSRSRLIACEALAVTQPLCQEPWPQFGQREAQNPGSTAQRAWHVPRTRPRWVVPWWGARGGESGSGILLALLSGKGCSLHPIPFKTHIFLIFVPNWGCSQAFRDETANAASCKATISGASSTFSNRG